MTPTTTQTPQPETVQLPNVNLEVQIAVLTEKVNQVIGDHERRIQALESRRDGGGARMAAIIGPYIAGAAVLIAIAGKVPWVNG